MNNIPDRHDEPDLEFLDLPDGWTLLTELPNNISDALFADFLHEMATSTKSHMQIIFDRAIQAQASREKYIEDATSDSLSAYESNLRRVLLAIIDCGTKAGNSDYAEAMWLEHTRGA